MTALNKTLFIYGSISYFDKKSENEIFKIISPDNFLRFYVEKDTARDSVSFQLMGVSGKIPKLKGKKIYLSLTRIGQKRKWQMAEPNETVIIHAQQNFQIAGGLNPVQIETEDDRVLNMLRRI